MNVEEVKQEIDKHKEDSKEYIDIVNKLVVESTSYLDELTLEISNTLKDPNFILNVDVLQPYYIKLSTELYMMIDKLKSVDFTYLDTSKVYSSTYFNLLAAFSFFTTYWFPSFADRRT